MNKKSILWAIFLAGIASFIIFYRYTSLPQDLTRDEIEFSRFAVSLRDKGYTPYDSYATGHATLYFYILLASFKLLGLNQLALRLPSAIFGILGVLSMYWLFKNIWNDKHLKIQVPLLSKAMKMEYAWISAMLLATQRWYFNFARYSFEATFIVFLELVSLASLTAYLKSKKIGWLLISALFCGLAYNSYQPGRLFVVVPLLTLIIFPALRSLKNIALYICVFLITIAPITMYFMQHQDTRLKQQLYFADKNLNTAEKMQFLGKNIVSTTQMFFWKGDVNGLHNYPYKPAVTPIIAICMLVGILYALKGYKSPLNMLFIAYSAIALVPTLLTYPHENPNMLRTITFLPSLIYFVGLGISSMYEELRKVKKYSFLSRYAGLFIVSVLLISALMDIRTYFVFQRKVFEESFEIKDGFAGVYVFMRNNDIPLGSFMLSEKEYRRYRRFDKENNQPLNEPYLNK